jgi:hypothetical protein
VLVMLAKLVKLVKLVELVMLVEVVKSNWGFVSLDKFDSINGLITLYVIPVKRHPLKFNFKTLTL